MSEIPCVNCGEPVETTARACTVCGADIEDIGAAPTKQAAGLHPLAPVVFLVVALGVAVAATLASSLAIGVPLGLVGGGIGVWILERGRRLTG
jgi:hypothetical protein